MVNVQINQSPSNIFSSFFLHIILGFNQFVHLLSVMLSNRREVCWNDKNYFIDIVDRMRHGGWGRFFCCLDRKEKTIQKCNLCMYNFSLFVKVIRKQKILSLSAHSCFLFFFKCWLNSYLGKWFFVGRRRHKGGRGWWVIKGGGHKGLGGFNRHCAIP